jgi:hypothetical protein
MQLHYCKGSCGYWRYARIRQDQTSPNDQPTKIWCLLNLSSWRIQIHYSWDGKRIQVNLSLLLVDIWVLETHARQLKLKCCLCIQVSYHSQWESESHEWLNTESLSVCQQREFFAETENLWSSANSIDQIGCNWTSWIGRCGTFHWWMAYMVEPM